MKKNEGEAKDKPDFIRSIAVLLAFGAEKLYEILKDYNKFLLEQGIINVPEINLWIGFYRNNKKIYEKCKELFIKSVVNNNVLINLAFIQQKELFSYFNISLETVLDDVKFFSPRDKEILLEKFDKLNLKNFDGKIGSDLTLPMSKDKILDIPEFVFYTRVWFPCWIIYGEFPTFLYRRARQGNLEDLCRLLRLDKAITHDKRIGALVQQISLNPESEEFRQINNAMKSTIKVTSRKKMKMRLASFIFKYASFLGIDLSTPEIQKLFDSISRHVYSEKLDDTDLPESPGAFYINLRRQSKKWNVIPDSLPHPDKK